MAKKLADKKRVVEGLVLGEISAVDRPMQEGARHVLTKRAQKPKDDELPETEDEVAEGQTKGKKKPAKTEKRGAITTEESDHTHSISLDSYDGMRTSGTTSYENGHSHPWVMVDDGEYVIGAARGQQLTGGVWTIDQQSHTHEIAIVGKVADDAPESSTGAPASGRDDNDAGTTKQGDTMTPEELKKQQEAHAAAIAKSEQEKKDLAEQLRIANKRAELTDAERAFVKNLQPAEVVKFLDATPEVRAADVAKAAQSAVDANPVVFKAADGTEFRKSDDARLVKMARERDDDRKVAAEATEKAAVATFEKRAASELANCPGEITQKVALLRAVDGVKDEATRKGIEAILKAADGALQTLGKMHGTTTAERGGASDPDAQMLALAKKFQDADPTLTKEQAYAKAFSSPAGSEIQKRMVEAEQTA